MKTRCSATLRKKGTTGASLRSARNCWKVRPPRPGLADLEGFGMAFENWRPDVLAVGTTTPLISSISSPMEALSSVDVVAVCMVLCMLTRVAVIVIVLV